MTESEYKEVLNAVEHGDNKAKTRLAWYQLSGCGGAVVDKDNAVVLLEERAEVDKDAEAMWMLGLCYEFGMGCEHDFARAEMLYGNSCNGGNAVGEFLSRHGLQNRGSGVMIIGQGLCKIVDVCYEEH